MSAPTERRCICGCAETTHAFDGDKSICSRKGCACVEFHLWEVAFQDPAGGVHIVTDVAKFVRDNQGLFDPDDVIERPMPCASYLHGLAGVNIRAEKGLDSLVGGRRIEHWKGWTVMTYPKTYLS